MNKITFETIKKANESIVTLDVKGKDYAQVNERIKAFRMVYPEGTIQTEMVSNDNGVCIFKAIVGYYNDDATIIQVLGTGTAYEKENSTFINKTSYIENCETSAVGRALGMAGFGIDTSVCSAEEVQNAIANQNKTEAAEEENTQAHTNYEMAFTKLLDEEGLDYDKVCELYKVEDVHKMSVKQYQHGIKNIEELKKKVQ